MGSICTGPKRQSSLVTRRKPLARSNISTNSRRVGGESGLWAENVEGNGHAALLVTGFS